MPHGEVPKVVIGIVTCNHRKFIKQCLDSVRASSKFTSIKVVVVDSFSSDGSAEIVRTHYPWVELIELKRTSSFATNNNLAFAAFSSDYFLMLNPDTVVDPGAVATLVEFMERHPDCGACGSKLAFPDGSLQLSCRKFPTVWSTLLRRTPVRVFLPKNLRGTKHLMAFDSHDNDMPVDWLLGACILVRREAIVGPVLLDEAFPLYCEEIDLCFRLKKGGWATYYVPRAKVIHHHLAKSDSTFFCRASWLHALSMIHFIKKHYFSPDRDTYGISGVNRRAAVVGHMHASQDA